MADKKQMPVTPEDIEDAVRRLWQLETFLEELTGVLYDNDFFSDKLRSEIHNIYHTKF